MSLSEFEIKQTLQLSAAERNEYFFKMTEASEQFYVLRNDYGEFAIREVSGSKFFPIWPSKEYAQLYIDGDNYWISFKVIEMTIKDLLNVWPLVKAENYIIEVFPLGDMTGLGINNKIFIENLKRGIYYNRLSNNKPGNPGEDVL